MSSSDPAPLIKIFLHGAFRVESAAGAVVTPKSQKAQGLLALLATSETRQRSRQWLQATLWSDRAREQASGSMRQALAQIKHALGPDHRDVIAADRHRVWLDPSAVMVCLPNGEEFLEGIDARDEAFMEWVLEQRSMRQGPGTRAAKGQSAPTRSLATRKFDISCAAYGGDLAQWFNRVFTDSTSRHLREFFSADVHIDYKGSPDKDLWRVRLESYANDQHSLHVRLSLENPARQSQLWSDHRNVQLQGGPPIEDREVLRLLNELIQAIGDEFLKESDDERDDADLLCRRAIRSFFTIKEDSVAEADDLIRRAYEIEPRGLFLAWRGQIRTVQGIERYYTDAQTIADEGEQFAEQALEIEPNNSMVLATAANTFGHLLKQKDRALELSKQSVLQNSANPMAWWALSSANAYTGEIEQSYRSAMTARQLALLSPNRFWWDNQVFGPAMLLGQIRTARKFAESSYARNRTFRSNLRYLIAFYANEGRYEDALDIAARLKELEPDFSLERLVKDPDYPASLLHRAPGLDLKNVEDLI